MLTVETISPWGERHEEVRLYRFRCMARLAALLDGTAEPTGQIETKATVTPVE